LAVGQAAVKNGALQVSNFGDCTPMRMSERPELDVPIIANNAPPLGCGEPAVTVGVRVRRKLEAENNFCFIKSREYDARL
jgi:hypothetical protein